MQNQLENNKIQNQNNEQEIDLLELAARLWTKRKFILKITSAFILLGLFVAIFSPKEYSASCTFVPQTNSKGASSSASALAAMAGISLGEMGATEVLSPKVYPKLMANVNLQKELMYTKLNFNGFKEPVSFIDYYTNPKYRKFSLIGAIKKYTIGLPFMLLNAIRGEAKEEVLGTGDKNKISVLSKEELYCIKALKAKVAMSLNDKEGYITISANMPEPLAAAQLATKLQELIQKYVTEFKLAKAQAQLDYINSRYAEAKADYDAKQEEFARFQDANKVFSSAVAQVKGERIRNDFLLANTLFSELAKQKMQAELKVKEDTPILTVVDPVVVPREKSKPKRAMILVVFTFLGGVMACGVVFGLDFLKGKLDIKYLKNWK